MALFDRPFVEFDSGYPAGVRSSDFDMPSTGKAVEPFDLAALEGCRKQKHPWRFYRHLGEEACSACGQIKSIWVRKSRD